MHIPFVEFNDISTEEPGDDILATYSYANSDTIYMFGEVTHEIKQDTQIKLEAFDDIRQDMTCLK